MENKVYFSGSFDILNIGHIESFKILRRMADNLDAELIVGVNTDELYNDYKGYKPILSFKERFEIVSAIKYIDKVTPQPEFKTTNSLKKYKINYYVISEEWIKDKNEEREYMLNSGGMVAVLPYVKKGLSSSQIKNKIKEEWKIKK